MTEEEAVNACSSVRPRPPNQHCRLCCAPEDECISILNSYAADKEPLATKIYTCVNVKITPQDQLSLKVCHACISYLNSWQSFKNRCLSSQHRQFNQLSPEQQNSQQLAAENDDQHGSSDGGLATGSSGGAAGIGGEAEAGANNLEGTFSSLKKRKSLTVYTLPPIPIKDEPMDVEDGCCQDDDSDDLVDPTLFLEQTEHEGDTPIMGPNFDYTGNNIMHAAGNSDQILLDGAVAMAGGASSGADRKLASCRACNLQFSTRANARRHERNLHPTLFQLTTETSNNTPVTKPTAALAAALEKQRLATLGASLTAAATTAAGVGADAHINNNSNNNHNNSSSSISSQKYRQQVVTAFNNSDGIGFDYENPEKYKHLLIAENIAFIQRNREFLEQFQMMTCRCCNKFYATYKNFMSHMRKNYPTLPRNFCFNCLKLNDSKSLFISHLKRRNCINLFKVFTKLMEKNPEFAVMASNSDMAPKRVYAKEFLMNKAYSCKLCKKEFRLKHEFRTHVYDRHGEMQRRDSNSLHCAFCDLKFEDATQRKRHYHKMDCVVILRCGTCQEVFESHHKFTEHVYQQHLGSSNDSAAAAAANIDGSSSNKSGQTVGGRLEGEQGARSSNNPIGSSSSSGKVQYFSRMPQACKICGSKYNNYNNVLRHMESKHPDRLPETYKCLQCGAGFPRVSNLRDHMVNMHGADKNRAVNSFEYATNAAERLKSVEYNFSSGGHDDEHATINGNSTVPHNEDATQLDDSEIENPAKRLCLDTSAGPKECPICHAVFNNNIGLSNHMRSHTAAAAAAAAASTTTTASTAAALSTTSASAATAAAFAAATRNTPNSLTITAMQTNNALDSLPSSLQQMSQQQQQTVVSNQTRRSMEQAADRRFRRMRCRICLRRFSSKKSYHFHMQSEHQISDVQFINCKICGAEFAFEKGLKVHMFKKHHTLIKQRRANKSQYECDICLTAYSSESVLADHKLAAHGIVQQQQQHKQQQHVQGNIANVGINENRATEMIVSTKTVDNTVTGATAAETEAYAFGNRALYWYQCKYCPSNFNTNKKLAIHINSHDEFDSKDYSCKDCGNVYSGRKSLWVHRYKKHPRIPDPAQCDRCIRLFFDRQMLENHKRFCTGKEVNTEESGAEQRNSQADQPTPIHADTTSMTMAIKTKPVQAAIVSTLPRYDAKVEPDIAALNRRMLSVECTICKMTISDPDVFQKHIMQHEADLYKDDPLSAMFDDSPIDQNQFFLDRRNDNGEYACDLCPKIFAQVPALKMHRKWHFRGDNQQNLNGQTHNTSTAAAAIASSSSNNHHNNNNSISGGIHNSSISTSTLDRQMSGQVLLPELQAAAGLHLQKTSSKRRRELKCEYCPSTFTSNNNLRRHMFELHKEALNSLPPAPQIDVDPYLGCNRCNLRFDTKTEWIEHKVNEARNKRPFGPFQWGCDLCGEYVSRKEKLINHIYAHLREAEIVPVYQRPSVNVTDDDSQSASNSVGKHSAGETNVNGRADEAEDEDTDNDDAEEDAAQADASAANQNGGSKHDRDHVSVDISSEDDVVDDEDDEEVDDEDDEEVDDEEDEIDDDDDDEDEDVEDDDDDDIDGDGDENDVEDIKARETTNMDGRTVNAKLNANSDLTSNAVEEIESRTKMRQSATNGQESNDAHFYSHLADGRNHYPSSPSSSTTSSMETMQQQPGGVTFPCDRCPARFDSDEQLQKHLKHHMI